MASLKRAIIISWGVPLRAAPHKNFTRPSEGVLRNLAYGTQVSVLSRQGDWLYVQVASSNKTLAGYVAYRAVKFEDAPSPSTVSLNIRPQVGPDRRIATTPQANSSVEHRNDVLDGLQTVLDFVGIIPGIGEVADLTNAGISALRGQYLEAALSLISLIPGVGDAIGKGAKYALKFADVGVARKALAALKSVDLAGYLKNLARHPQFVKYVGSLRQALIVLEQKLTQLARGPTHQFALPGGGWTSSAPMRNNISQMSAQAAGGYKKGDHVFNHGLTKLGLTVPKSSLLEAAFSRFQIGLKEIELKGGFKLVASKGAHAADLNSKLFGHRLEELRDAWAQLDRVFSNPSANVQHRAEAVRWTTDALKRLRQASFDEDALLARVRSANASDARKFKEEVKQTAKALDSVFDGLTKELEKFMPSSGAVGLSMTGHRGRTARPRRR